VPSEGLILATTERYSRVLLITHGAIVPGPELARLRPWSLTFFRNLVGASPDPCPAETDAWSSAQSRLQGTTNSGTE